MTTAPAVEVRKVGRLFAICAGRSVLRRFRSESAAVADLEANRLLWSYWAGSESVSFENSEPVTIWA